MLTQLLTLAVILATQAGDSSCQDSSDPTRTTVCQVDTRGIRVESGGAVVVDVITARCDVPPREHRLEAWLEYRKGIWGEWTMPRGPELLYGIPGPDGDPVQVELPCKAGYYRAAWRATGRGPALPDHPQGLPFDIQDGDWGHTPVDATECGE